MGLKRGDVVRVKLGSSVDPTGKAMTVESASPAGVLCLWFAEGELRSGEFRPDRLKVVPEPSSLPKVPS